MLQLGPVRQFVKSEGQRPSRTTSRSSGCFGRHILEDELLLNTIVHAGKGQIPGRYLPFLGLCQAQGTWSDHAACRDSP